MYAKLMKSGRVARVKKLDEDGLSVYEVYENLSDLLEKKPIYTSIEFRYMSLAIECMYAYCDGADQAFSDSLWE